MQKLKKSSNVSLMLRCVMCKAVLVLETIKKTKGRGGMSALQVQLAEAQTDDLMAMKEEIKGVKADIAAEGQKTRDMLSQDKIEALQGKVAQLELANQLAGVVRYPNGWTYDAGRSPFCGGGCNCFNG